MTVIATDYENILITRIVVTVLDDCFEIVSEFNTNIRDLRY